MVHQSLDGKRPLSEFADGTQAHDVGGRGGVGINSEGSQVSFWADRMFWKQAEGVLVPHREHATGYKVAHFKIIGFTLESRLN